MVAFEIQACLGFCSHNLQTDTCKPPRCTEGCYCQLKSVQPVFLSWMVIFVCEVCGIVLVDSICTEIIETKSDI